MNKIRKEIIQNNEISEVCEVELGGYSQKIMIDGKKRSNPLLICLHGGPGTPIPFSVGCRGMFPDITDKLTLVCWDQLGCGINNRVIDDTFTVNHFVDMTVDLIQEIRKRFPENKVYIFGVSWGSILAVKAVNRAEGLVDGVITYGQVLCNLTFNQEVYQALEQSAMSQKKKDLLNEMKNEPTIDYGKKIMGWIRKYTDGYNGKAGEKSPMGSMILGLLTSPDYKFRDFKAIVMNGYSKNKSLLAELFNVDLKKEFVDVKIPYTIIQGDMDIVTSTKNIVKFVSECNNANIRVITVPDNGHMPNNKAMECVIHEIVQMIER